jgi:hypothetical protein
MAKGKGGFIGQDGLNAPDSPTAVSGTAGNESVSVAFTAPSDVGGSAITGYRVQDGTNAHGASGSSSPVTVTGLTNGTSYTFNVWAINAFGYSAPSDASTGVSPVQPTLGVWFGGSSFSGSRQNNIETINIDALGNGTDFGDLSVATQGAAGNSSSTRACCSLGSTGSGYVTTIEQIQYATSGNSTNFGNITVARGFFAGSGNSTRGVFAGGYSGSAQNVIDYITFSSAGNATDFGNLSSGCSDTKASSSPTRTVIAQGIQGGSTIVNNIDYITTASTGNASDFGDLTVSRYGAASSSSSTRALFFGGGNSSGNSVDTIDYVTISSTGNATDFGNVSVSGGVLQAGSCSNGTRSLINFGRSSPSTEVHYVTIASTGNTVAFGNMNYAATRTTATSQAHGGLS